ncbi:acyltransferase family protein, partial [Georgenia sp.]
MKVAETQVGTRARGPAARARGQSARHGHIEGLDGVRALAIVAVLVYHLHPAALPGGFLGVDIFFVVSGFLITTLLLREIGTKNRIDLRRFWLRRARRLLPALVAVVLVSIPFAWLAATDLLVSIGRQALGALTFSNNWLEIAAGTSYFTSTAPQLFVNFWSLAVEEQFYLLWPVTLAGLVAAVADPRRRALVTLGAGAVSAMLMAVLYTPGEDATRVYYGTDTHLFGLMIGAALAFTWAAPHGGILGARPWRRWRGLVSLLALVGLAVLMLTIRQPSTFTFRGGILLASLLTAVLLAGLLGPTGPVRALMRLRPLEWLGERSYGIYLWHWPIILVVDELVPTAYDTWGYWGVRGLALALTLGVAALSYRHLEQPVRILGFRGAWRELWGALAGVVPGRRTLARVVAAGGAAAVALSLAAIAVAPERSQTQVQIEAAQAALDASVDAAQDAVEPPD